MLGIDFINLPLNSWAMLSNTGWKILRKSFSILFLTFFVSFIYISLCIYRVDRYIVIYRENYDCITKLQGTLFARVELL